MGPEEGPSGLTCVVAPGSTSCLQREKVPPSTHGTGAQGVLTPSSAFRGSYKATVLGLREISSPICSQMAPRALGRQRCLTLSSQTNWILLAYSVKGLSLQTCPWCSQELALCDPVLQSCPEHMLTLLWPEILCPWLWASARKSSSIGSNMPSGNLKSAPPCCPEATVPTTGPHEHLALAGLLQSYTDSPPLPLCISMQLT